ncbi:lipase 1-like [Pararge aegeria]|uniref:Lipase n=1 Tax=Pararge aegeria aegeria TaxID=348720 RepID=A0A8S4S5J5_9NEOP|nr:lipase 1-like [Pararge aegeria]CAH2255144.1 jg7242 [Pararge aegeria aegeria]
MANTISYLVLFYMFSDCLTQCSQNDIKNGDSPPIKTLNFTQIAAQVGYAVNEYDVTTQDAYILKLFHIPGDKTKPVLLMHGIIDSADTFILRGNTSLAVTLSRAGYDVWIGNTRGNRYARRHIYLHPENDVEFWDFSFHEYGLYDLPAIIDFILDQTGEASLSAVGHSQGSTNFLVLGALRPDYNEKVKVLVALSPICFLANVKNVASLMLQSVSILDQIYQITGQEELFGDETSLGQLFRAVCGCKGSYSVCAYGIFFPVAGSDPEELEPDFFPTIVAHYPTGTSRKNAVHVSQLGIKEKFSNFDYQWRNVDIYNSTTPPEYELSNVTMKVALLVGRNDQISTIKDVELLRSKLPNVVEYKIIHHKKFNHIDAVWGRNMYKYLFPEILKVLKNI